MVNPIKTIQANNPSNPKTTDTTKSIATTLRENFLSSEIDKIIGNSLMDCIDSAFDIKSRCKRLLGITVEDNQIEIVETILDRSANKIALKASRSGGKTFGIILGIGLFSMDYRVSVGITAPSKSQATRIVNTFYQEVVAISPQIKEKLDWKSCTNTKVVFKSGSYWEAFSASEVSSQEGLHFDLLVCDEAQDISDLSMSQILLPMIGQSPYHKVIKLGVPRGVGHFYNSFKSSDYVSLSYDWLHCGNLLRGGYKEINGIKYPTSVLEIMPLPKYKEYFPNNPELWQETAGVSVEDFESQYECQFHESISTLLTTADMQLLIGDFPVIEPVTDMYFFGLDLAGGSQIKLGSKRDYTSLTIGRKIGGVVRVEMKYEFQGDVTSQIEKIEAIVHPVYGKWKCKFGYADCGEMGVAVVDVLKKDGIPVEGIMFGSRDSNSGKNMKNAMYDHLLFELRSGNYKYPSMASINAHTLFKKHYNEWSMMEREIGIGVNAKIQAPSGFHDDGMSSEILLLWAINKSNQSQLANKRSMFEGAKGIPMLPIYKVGGRGGSGIGSGMPVDGPDLEIPRE